MLGRKAPPTTEATEDKRGFDAFDLQLGDIMRGERATLGKSLLDVQRELKIKATYIAAVENADPSVFESPGFIAGYVRSYARYLGMDPDWAYSRFCEESGFAGVEGLSNINSAKPSKPSTRSRGFGEDMNAQTFASYAPLRESILSRIEPGAIGSTAVLFALIGAIGYGGWAVLQEVQRVQFAPVEQAPGVIAEIEPFASDPDAEGADNDLIAGTSGFTRPSADALDRLYRPQALEAPVLTARDGPIAALDPGSIGALVDEPVRQAAVAPKAIEADPVLPEAPSVQVVTQVSDEVVLFAVRPTWIRVSLEDGSVLFEKTLNKGEQYEVPVSEDAPLLRVGNAGGLYFNMQGKTYGPAGVGATIAKNIALSVDDISANYAQADLEADPALGDVLVAMAEASNFGEDPVIESPVSE